MGLLVEALWASVPSVEGSQMAKEGAEVVRGVTAVAVVPAEVSILAVRSARTEPPVSRPLMERLVREFEAAVLVLKVVPQASSQGLFLSFAALQLLELLRLLKNKLLSSLTAY